MKRWQLKHNSNSGQLKCWQKDFIIETALDPTSNSGMNKHSSLLKPEGLQAGAAVIDNETREIVSLFAGKDYKKADFHRAFQAVSQPGSAIKPILVYAPFFESWTLYSKTRPSTAVIFASVRTARPISADTYMGMSR